MPTKSLRLQRPFFLFMILSCTRLRWSRYASSSAASGLALAAFQKVETTLLRQSPCRLLHSNNNNNHPVYQTHEISPSDHGTTPLQRLDKGTGFHPVLKKAIRQQAGLVETTPIQKHAIPLLSKGYDVLASASTGSGKTYMFALPLLDHLLQRKKLKKQRPQQPQPAALIMNPTRELAMQTASVLKALQLPGLGVGLAVGGTQQQPLTGGSLDILVGTPGRVLQLSEERKISLRHVQVAVIDEADRMLDLGFEPQLQRIARQLSSAERQTILCSATFPEAVQRIASEYLKEHYYFVAAGRVGGLRSHVQHDLIWKHKTTTRETLHNMLTNAQNEKTLVFCNTKTECEYLGKQLVGSRVATGDKSQEERNRAVADLASGRHNLLVATDVAARGLDIPDILRVVQVDAPRDIDTWVHRVGRTGRGVTTTTMTGKAVTFMNASNSKLAGPMIDLLRHHQAEAIPPWLFGMAHVARARELDEMGAIAAGGGGGTESAVDHSQAIDNAQYSVQDFRRTAQEGSWGSERDTTYASFEKDAYSSLEETASEPIETQLNETKAAVTETPIVGPLPKTVPPAADVDNLAFFQQSPLGEELSAALKEISGSASLQSPQKDVLRALSRGSDERLRFEYIGHFPFQEIESLLRSPRKHESFKQDGMLKVLMVAEKPSIAKAVADALSGPKGPRQRRGISRGLPVYEFTTDQFREGNATANSLVTVTSVVGHVFSLGFQENQERKVGGSASQKNQDPARYFDLPVIKQEEGSTGKLRVVDHLQALAAGMDHLVLWLDCDAEGENIAHEVIGVTRRALEPKIAQERAQNESQPLTRRIHRANFSSITKEALTDAFMNLGAPNGKLSRAVDARQELDLRVGVAFTRLLTWRCVGYARRRFAASTKLVSYGPCQTPALSFCVDRAKEIEKFTPEKFTKIKTKALLLNANNQIIDLRWRPDSVVQNNSKRGMVVEQSATTDRQVARDVMELAKHPQAHFIVTKVEEQSETIKAPAGLNTVALLSAGSRAMGMSPKSVLKVAEQLYSQGLVSYPRTESTRYDPNGFNVQTILREHTKHEEWGKTAGHLLRTKYSKNSSPPSRGRDVGDHPPITCLKPANRDEVGGGVAWRVYDFIARTFIGSLADDLKFTRRIAKLELVSPLSGAVAHKFEVENVSVDSLGFGAACTWVLKDIGAPRKESEQLKFRQGMKLKVQNIDMEDCSTRPPPFIQEHELIELMDKNRIGTDASMATHVSNIVDRGYVVLCDEEGVPVRAPGPPSSRKRLPRQIGRYLVPTPLGLSLIGLFEGSSHTANDSVAMLSRPQIRAQMEEEVKRVATGELDKDACVEKNLDWFRERYNDFVGSLTRGRLNKFENSLEDTRASLKRWRGLGAFGPEEVGTSKQKVSSNNKPHRRADSKTNKHRKYTKEHSKVHSKRSNQKKTTQGI